ncbi:probable ATP-dependent RNA helicase DDX4 isoform X7 [Pseudophryne corroboree]|uniref:probable ATP-dependent RNA helicase DDX4 isoform X7 n=1 Tax=Pseudophryne corroboree TaxID=495146 RepID=UPI003081D7F7
MSEDWESELDSSPACVPNFTNLEPDRQERARNSYASNSEFNQNFGSAERCFGSQRGNRSDGGGFDRGNRSDGGSFDRGNRSDGSFDRGHLVCLGAPESCQWTSQPRTPQYGPCLPGNRSDRGSFDRGRGRGSSGMFSREYGERENENQSQSSWRGGFNDNDRSKRNGFQRRGGFDSENGNESRGFSGRDGFNNENSGFGSRGRRGGRGDERGDTDDTRDFGRRGDRGDTDNTRGFGRRGGYRGRNEDIGVESGKGQDDFEKSDLGPKVSYIPPPPPESEDDIFKHYQTGINFDKYDDIVVDVSGIDAPPAILTFEEANLSDTLYRNVAKAGYVKLTPIQKHSIPIIIAGRDLMACAQTGSGKTAAFLLPILAYMMKNGITASKFKELQEPEAIIIAPTRELINQIYLEARKFSYGTCVRPVVIYGGTQTGHSLQQISQGVNILCATPGRLLDVIDKRKKIGLSKLKYLVLDEADRMLDMGFQEDIMKLLQNADIPSREERQTLMFSATFPAPIQSLAREILKTDYLFVVVGQVGGACSDVEQRIVEVEEYGKKDKLLEILQNIGHERTMVFVKTKKKADFIASFLCQEKISTTSIHGDREQRERETALHSFRCGQCPVIVATSVAARGLDIENVLHVINFDIPGDIDEYVHRIGRTGRCGNIGKAISFFDRRGDDEQRVVRSLVKVLTDAHQEVPAWLEEIAFSAHGMSSYNPQANKFASVDNRKKGGFQEDNYSSQGFSQSATVADEEENWG